MIHNNEIMNLKAIMNNKDTCTINRMYGTYVAGGVRVFDINESFLNLPEEEQEQYRGFLGQIFSKKIGDELLELNLKPHESIIGDLNDILNTEDSLLLNDLYSRVMNQYEIDSYVILVFKGVIDLPGRHGKDSEEVYSHIICMVCTVPHVGLGLGYIPDANQICDGGKMWRVVSPHRAFIWPALDNSEVYTDRIMYYTDNPCIPGHEFIENCLECEPVMTDTEIRRDFENLFTAELGKELGNKVLAVVNKKMQECIDYNEQLNARGQNVDSSYKLLSLDDLKHYMEYAPVKAEQAQGILNGYSAKYRERYPRKKTLVRSRYIKKYNELEEENKLLNALNSAVLEIEASNKHTTELSLELRELIARRK